MNVPKFYLQLLLLLLLLLLLSTAAAAVYANTICAAVVMLMLFAVVDVHALAAAAEGVNNTGIYGSLQQPQLVRKFSVDETSLCAVFGHSTSSSRT